MKFRSLLAATLSVTSVVVFAADGNLSTDKEKFSYAVGFQIGQSLKQDSSLDVDPGVLSQAIQDVLKGSKLKLSMEEMKAAVDAFQKKQMQAHQEVAEKNKKAGEAFLAENKKKPGIKVLPSGLQYKVVKKGEGPKPKSSDTVVVNYRGTLTNGKEFDSSYRRGQPTTFPVDGVIPGWTEALQLMSKGAQWQIYIPAGLAYGEHGAGNAIGPNEALIFDVELLDIK